MSPFSAVGTIGPAFFLAIAMFNFVLQMSSLVTEKELKLRQVWYTQSNEHYCTANVENAKISS